MEQNLYVFVMYNQKPAFTAGFVSQHKSCGNQTHDEVVFKWPGCGIFEQSDKNLLFLEFASERVTKNPSAINKYR